MRCRICRCKFQKEQLTDGRCRGCRRAAEATQAGMHYGDYINLVSPPKTAEKAEPEEDIIVEEPERSGAKGCVICGKPIDSTRKNCVTCSRECSDERRRQQAQDFYNRKKHGIVERVTCAECGKEFVKSKQHIVTCSLECRKARERKKQISYGVSYRAAKKAEKEDLMW